MDSSSGYLKTTNISKIKLWTSRRGGKPAIIKDTDILKIKLPKNGQLEHELEIIDWTKFSNLFNKYDCLFLYEDDLNSTFYKLIKHGAK